MSVNLSRIERNKRPMGDSGWGCLGGTTNVLHKRDGQGSVAWWIGVGFDGEGRGEKHRKDRGLEGSTSGIIFEG